MNRLATGLAIAGSLWARYASAESQADIASKENDDGKALMFQKDYKGAAEKFRDAADRAPEAKYFFNLCSAVYQEGIFGEAMTACNNADKLSPDDALKGKLGKLEDKIRSDAADQHIDLSPTGQTMTAGGASGGDVGTTSAGGGPVSTGGQPPPMQYAVGRPSQDLMAIVPPEHNYTWTLGVDVLGGTGRIGDSGYFGTSSAGIRVKSDLMVLPRYKFGLEGYIQYQHFGTGSMSTADAGTQQLDIFDIGVAAYKHFCGTSRFCVTPLLGIQLALMSPDNMQDSAGSQVFNYAALGARGEVALQYALGPRMEHVISLAVGANVYTEALLSPSDTSSSDALTAPEVGLDSGGIAGYISLGYTYRFNTPLGAGAFITLE